MEPKTFKLIRNVNDEAKIIATGVIFENDKCVVAWNGEQQSVVVWNNFYDMLKINGHSNTRVVFYGAQLKNNKE